jgi:hypothetical protein
MNHIAAYRQTLRRALFMACAACLIIALPTLVDAQTAPVPAPSAPAVESGQKGGIIHGSIKAGTTPLPGVSITASNTLTGKKFSTTTAIDGSYTMSIPQNGRYVLRAELAAFAPTTKEALLNAAGHDQLVDFAMILQSRMQQQEDRQRQQAGQVASALRQYAGSGAQSLGLLSSETGLIEAGNSASGASLPSLANNSDFSSDSVAVSGQSGTTSPLAGIDMDQLRQGMDGAELQRSLSDSQGGRGGGGAGGGGGGRGGFGGGGGGGGFNIGRGNFRNLKPNQPHGAIFWTGGNSALNAQSFALRGQTNANPGYSSNRYGLTFASAPYIPKLMAKPSSRDFLFLTISGQRVTSPFDEYGTVPTTAERGGDFSGLTNSQGQPIIIYDPKTGQPFPGNQIPAATPEALSLLRYLPAPNLQGSLQNYHLLTTTGSNTDLVGLRFAHNFGASATQGGVASMIRQALGAGGPGLHQNMNANFNYSHSASDKVNLFPELGGKQQSHQYALTAGYTIGYGKLNNNLSLAWNRSVSQLGNFFTGITDVATQSGVLGPDGAPINVDPLNYGLPNVVFSQLNGLNETQPNFRTSQTISFTESTSWIRGKHNLRFGGDFRRVHLDLLGGTNATGTFYFTGVVTQAPGGATTNQTSTGSSFADFLLGQPQETTIQAPQKKAYMRANVWDGFAQDDWRAASNFTVIAGLRYEYFSPYSEKYDRLANLDHSPDFSTVIPILPNQVGPYSGKFDRSLIDPFHAAFSPRFGFALRPMKDTVVRGGYGINFTNGQYANFIQNLAYQPPFANVQTNQLSEGTDITLADGFPAPQAIGNYSVNKHYRLPYVQVWNLDIQRTLPFEIVLNIGYNGSKGSKLDILDAPGRSDAGSTSGAFFNFEDSVAFSNFNALTVRARRRLHSGVSMGATYTYSHSIDNAGSIGGASPIVAQNWQDLLAEEGNSSFDVRQKLAGDYLFELPFGPDKKLLSGGNWLSHAASNWSVSGSFDFATGTPLTPRFAAAVADVSRGTAGSLRPDRVPGVSITAGGGTLNSWFNRAAFSSVFAPGQIYGTASRNSIPGPGTITNNMSLSKTIRFADMRSLEFRATANNVFNTVQYASVDTQVDSPTAGFVLSAESMRQFTFNTRFRF